ncbi:methylglyoxal synthase [Yinghuangia soli]|uniref:Methylglyoxal synthase n=1 Tax=Yinghuangia soli TaxID=2908204 RepID=A0AA41U1U0_9ACTN|nr:methylglyoxal synthase [Yinghuangia soli]MCF2527912.1 methylglyoxal synthase [Yinghuangia soli]
MTTQLHTPAADVMGIALVAHDSCKPDMVAWAREHQAILGQHRLYATGTTGGLVADETGLPVVRFRSGPLGGDQQVGARIAEGDIDLLIFFWDALTAQPHEPDVRALLRLAVLANVPVACNRATADLVITSPLLAAPDREHVDTRLAGRHTS